MAKIKNNSKKIIQEALKAELKNEGFFDQYVSDPISGLAQGIANVPRGIAGQIKLGQVNSKLKKTSERMKKDWDQAMQYADAKSDKMIASKNPNVARYGQQVKRNFQSLDGIMNQSLNKLGSLAAVGADNDAGLPSPSASKFPDLEEKGYRKWIRGSFGEDPNNLSAKSKQYMFGIYLDLLKKGVDPTQYDGKELFRKIQAGEFEGLGPNKGQAGPKKKKKPKSKLDKKIKKQLRNLPADQRVPAPEPAMAQEAPIPQEASVTPSSAPKPLEPNPKRASNKAALKKQLQKHLDAKRASKKVKSTIAPRPQANPKIQAGAASVPSAPSPVAQMPATQKDPVDIAEPAPIPLINRKPAQPEVQNLPKAENPSLQDMFSNQKTRPRPQINKQGEIQIGNPKTGESGLYPSKDRFGKFNTKSKKQKEEPREDDSKSKPSARRKKQK